MPDDNRTNDSSGGFDDWLDEDAGPDTDPYAELSDDDPEGEISDWMAFTQGEDGDGTATDSSAEPETAAPSSDSSKTLEPLSDEPDVADEPTAEIDVQPSDDDVTAEAGSEVATEEAAFVDFDGEEETAEIPVIAADDGEPADNSAEHAQESGTSVDVSEWDGGGRADTDEVPIISGADVVEASVVNVTDASKTLDDPDAIVEMPAIVIDAPANSADDPEDETDGDADTGLVANDGDLNADTGELDPVDPTDDAGAQSTDDDDDTGELEVAAIAGAGAAAAVATSTDFGDLWDQDANGNDVTRDGDEGSSSLFDISQGDYPQTATKEHVGLAAAIAQAEEEDTEQVALAAPIPGLESTVVGFDDVVEAEGHRKAKAKGSGNLVARVITAIVLIAALGASLVWRPALLLLATAVFVIGAGEFYTALTRTGRHPIAAFGFAGIIAACVGAYVSGAVAITTAMVLVTTIMLLYYAVVPGRRDPVANLGLTVTVMVWVSLGSYAMLITVSENWRPLVVGTVLVVAAMDIAQYFVGRAIGRHQLAPWVSPKKTVEGLVGGVIVALTCGALLHFVEPFELTSGLVLGAAVAVLAPLGDLAMSAAKRALDLKDMGSVLPGHGGFLDRIDGLLFVIPAAWAIFLWAGLL